jgi:excisionase family DNA binding protein
MGSEAKATIEDLMNHYQVDQRTIYNWRKQGLPYYRIGKVIRFDRKEVEEWMNKNKVIEG